MKVKIGPPLSVYTVNTHILWYSSDDLTFRRDVNLPIFFIFSSRTEYVKKIFVLRLCFIYTNEYKTQTNIKKSSETELRYFDFYRTGTIIFTGLAREFLLRWDNHFYYTGMVILTVFFRVLQKCYKITLLHSNFYLEFLYSFWQTFFHVGF